MRKCVSGIEGKSFKLTFKRILIQRHKIQTLESLFCLLLVWVWKQLVFIYGCVHRY